jgi:hypothetical protein
MPTGEKDGNQARYPLLRGHTRWQVIRDLAAGMTHVETAEKYGVHLESLVLFKKSHMADIKALQASVAEEADGLWIASKFNRVAEYQQAFEDVDQAIAQILDFGGTLGPAEMAIIKEKRGILKQVAEELGQLPPRNNVTVNGSAVSYHFDGVDPKDLT